MPSKAHPNHANKAAAKQQSSKPTIRHTTAITEHTHRAAIVERARFNPQSLTPRDVLELQRTIGNQAVQRLLGQAKPDGFKVHPGTIHFAQDFSRIPVAVRSQASIQAKLTVSSPGDIYEQEAEHVSEHVMGMSETRLQRACACGGACPKCQAGPPAQVRRLVQTKGARTNGAGAIAPSPIVDEVLETPGQPLDAGTRAFMEPRFGHDFSAVRVHTDSDAGSSAESVGARAFTVGNHVVFRAGEYRPGTADGQRLLAHELTHVAQQGAGSPLPGSVVQRDDKATPTPAPAPAKNTAAGGPQLDFQPAKNPPPCACIVFMHHNEANARLTAQVMYEFCHYNLAIVTPETKSRGINLPGKGTIDPNELFPRNVAEECWDDDKPCEDFMSKNAGATKGNMVEQYAQRQFFLSIKKCSEGFSLPVVALHNNDIQETAQYRQAVKNKKIDPTPIKGKTFNDALKAGEKSPDVDTLPFVDLQEWLKKNVPGVKEKAKPTGTKGKLESQGVGVLTPGKTNIFLWCSAEDITRCQIGDPERPDNVVWVTNEADFKKLQGTKANVVLQTRVDPSGKSATDLSSLFVFLKDIISTEFAFAIIKLEIDLLLDINALMKAIAGLQKLQQVGNAAPEKEKEELAKIIVQITRFFMRLHSIAMASGARDLKLSQLRFVNIETPQTTDDPNIKPGDLRVQGYRDVKETLKNLGLACCDEKPVAGETESAEEKVEKALRKGALPKAETK